MAKAKWVASAIDAIRENSWITIVFCFVASLSWVVIGWREPLIYGDSGDYIVGVEIRPPVYPAFIRAHLSGATLPWEKTAYAWPAIIRSQLLLIGSATAIFLGMLFRLRWWAPYVTILLYLGLRAIKSHWAHTLNNEIFYALLSEGLKLPWLIVLNTLVLGAIFRPTPWIFGFLGIWAYLGVEINPNCLTFGLLTLVPLIPWFSPERRRRIGRIALIAPLLFFCAYTVRCSIEKAKGGTYSVVPFDGFSTITVALQFAKPEQITLFKDRQEHRQFFELMLDEPCRTRRRSPECPEPTAFLFETRAFKKILPERAEGNYHFAMNRFFKEISGPLLTSRLDVFLDWQAWVLKNLLRGLQSFPIFRILWILIAGIVALSSHRLYRRTRDPIALAPFGYFVAYGATIYLATAFVVYDHRYVIFGELLLIPAAVLALINRSEETRRFGLGAE